jgi:hypothetical protein
MFPWASCIGGFLHWGLPALGAASQPGRLAGRLVESVSVPPFGSAAGHTVPGWAGQKNQPPSYHLLLSGPRTGSSIHPWPRFLPARPRPKQYECCIWHHHGQPRRFQSGANPATHSVSDRRTRCPASRHPLGHIAVLPLFPSPAAERACLCPSDRPCQFLDQLDFSRKCHHSLDAGLPDRLLPRTQGGIVGFGTPTQFEPVVAIYRAGKRKLDSARVGRGRDPSRRGMHRGGQNPYESIAGRVEPGAACLSGTGTVLLAPSAIPRFLLAALAARIRTGSPCGHSLSCPEVLLVLARHSPALPGLEFAGAARNPHSSRPSSCSPSTRSNISPHKRPN